VALALTFCYAYLIVLRLTLTCETYLSAQSELLSGVDAVKGAAKKALAAQEHSVEHSTATAASLQGLKQVLVLP
jgi:hypothetical protein